MSFRARMLLFFVIIVVIPMIAVALVLSSLVAESERGRADSDLAQGLEVAIADYREARSDAVDDLRRVTRDAQLRLAFDAGDNGTLARTVRSIVRRREPIVAVALYGEDLERLGVVGSGEAVAYATASPTEPDGTPIGTIAVSTTTARALARSIANLTNLGVRIVRDDAVLASTLADSGGSAFAEGGDAEPLATSVETGGTDYRGAYTTMRDAVGSPIHVGVFQDAEPIASSIAQSRWLVFGILFAFFALAVASSILIARSLGRQIDRFLGAARSVGRGDFEARVPAEGGDEFAALGREFNLMSERLERNVAELERRRAEREDAIRRVGEAFAAGLDRTGIARLAARTAVEACAAESGRVALVGADEGEGAAVVGDASPTLTGALAAAEEEARRAPDAPVATTREAAHALGAVLRGGLEPGGERAVIGFLSIGRVGYAFTEGDRELFSYLAAQASVSLDNATLHETVQAEAITDALTGLNNRRHFDSALEAEIGRVRRFGGEVGLVMLDLDGFKPINDTYGHQAGDRVLIEIARLLRQLTRDVDLLARYGGDEIAIILPQTDLAGSELLAERIRAGVEQLEVRAAGVEAPLRLTGSFGAAALPETAAGREELVAAADEALYRAKRAGGNGVARAGSIAVSG